MVWALVDSGKRCACFKESCGHPVTKPIEISKRVVTLGDSGLVCDDYELVLGFMKYSANFKNIWQKSKILDAIDVA